MWLEIQDISPRIFPRYTRLTREIAYCCPSVFAFIACCVAFPPKIVNTKSAEILYTAIQEWGSVSLNTILLGE